MVDDTSLTLLQAIRRSSDDERWQQLVELYVPFIRAILARKGIALHEADDLLQCVLVVLVRRLPEFDRQQTGSFRSWLRAITANVMRDHFRSKDRAPARGGDTMHELIEQLHDPRSDLSVYWDTEHDRHVLSYLLNQIKGDFQKTTFDAFYAVTIEGHDVDEVAARLGMTVNAVYIARSRIVKRLREIGAELLD